MRRIFIHTKRLLLLFLALQILNLSFDSIEFQPIDNSNALASFNDLNTAMEFVSEVVLQHTNAFPEYDNAGKTSQKNSPLQKQGSVKLYFFNSSLRVSPHSQLALANFILTNEKYTSSFFAEINPPPPKSIFS